MCSQPGHTVTWAAPTQIESCYRQCCTKLHLTLSKCDSSVCIPAVHPSAISCFKTLKLLSSLKTNRVLQMTPKFQISLRITSPPPFYYILTQNRRFVSNCVDTERFAFHCVISELQRYLMSAILSSSCPTQLHTHPERLEVASSTETSICGKMNSIESIDVTCGSMTDFY